MPAVSRRSRFQSAAPQHRIPGKSPSGVISESTDTGGVCAVYSTTPYSAFVILSRHDERFTQLAFDSLGVCRRSKQFKMSTFIAGRLLLAVGVL